KYFEHVYQPPNLKVAKKRGKQEVRYNRAVQIDEKYRVMGNERTFLIKTYGCQMIAHDTEVIAGILEALGYQATTD
ncbi:tRNA (N6-isopentenyl adenosine(37)-C2)-methylthiotransferase MiaB, partial [Staphylococcus aureus]|nr:tRNA (N6-isopentenyl adenosine(37)-C2)-methylthiotransferase MiaB [Staphylococcus aureus]